MATQVYLSKYTGAQIDALLDRASALSTAAGATVGSATKPIYLASGALTASGTTVGGAAKPIYLSSGNMTACSSTVGGAASSGVMTPIYMNAGTMTSCGATTYTAAQVDSLLAAKAASSHTHDDRYYTESEVNSLLSNKMNKEWTATGTLTAYSGSSANFIDNGYNYYAYNDRFCFIQIYLTVQTTGFASCRAFTQTLPNPIASNMHFEFFPWEQTTYYRPLIFNGGGTWQVRGGQSGKSYFINFIYPI